MFHLLPPLSMSIVILGLLILSASFSASETSLFSFRKTKLSMLVKQKNPTALLIQKILGEPEKLLSTILIGNNIVNTTASILATTLALALFGEKGIFIAILVMTFILIQFCEIIPKVLASQYWDRFAFALARPMRWFYYFFYFLIAFFSFLTRLLLIPFNIKIRYRRPVITKEELKHIVDMSTETGHLKEEETFLLHNVFEFTDRLVKEVMLPNEKITALEITTTQEKAMQIITEKHFTRIPVYEGSIDNIIGILHTKEYFNVVCYQNIIALPDLIRKPLFVSENTRISELLKEFQKKHIHLAIVKNEENNTIGIITLENILEQIVGEIRDEHK